MELEENSLSSLNISNNKNIKLETNLVMIKPTRKIKQELNEDANASICSKKIDSLFRDEEEIELKNPLKQNNFIEFKIPTIKNILRNSTQSISPKLQRFYNSPKKSVKFVLPDESRGEFKKVGNKSEEEIKELKENKEKGVFYLGEEDNEVDMNMSKNLSKSNEKSFFENSSNLDNSNSQICLISKSKTDSFEKFLQEEYILSKNKPDKPFDPILKFEESVIPQNPKNSSKNVKKYKRSSKRPIINKKAHQVKIKEIFNISSARERFKILFNKLRIILLFMYMIKRVKIYGLKVLRKDVINEIEKIEKLKLFESSMKDSCKQKEDNVLIRAKNKINITRGEGRKSIIDLLVRKKQIRQWNCMKCMIINPESIFMQFWNAVMTILIVYIATIVPYRTSFYDPPLAFTFWYIVDLISDILFFIDFLINCFQGFYNEKNDLVMQWSEIIINYATGWMLLDFISIFPFQYVISDDSESSARKIKATVSYLARLPRLFRLLKLFRIFRFLRLFNQVKFIKNYIQLLKLNGSIKRICTAFIVFLIFTHIFSCLWYFSAKLQDLNPHTWVFRAGLIDSDITFIYSSSIYFTLSVIATLGYGDIVASTNIEKAMVIILMTFGSILITIIISNLISALSQVDTKHILQQEKINILNKFASRVKLKNNIYLKIKKSFEDNSLNDLILNKDSLLKDLPYYLRIEVILFMQERYIKDIYYFRDKNSNFIIELIQNWRTIYFHKMDFIYFTSDFPENIYFIIKGMMSYMDDKGNILTTFSNGAILGEMEIILGDQKRFLNLRAEENCEVNVISGEMFKHILLKFSAEFRSSMRAVKLKYLKYQEFLADFEKNQKYDEKIKKEIEIYKTTSSYLSHLKKMRRQKIDVEVDIDLSDNEPDFGKSRSIMESHSLKSEDESNLRSFLSPNLHHARSQNPHTHVNQNSLLPQNLFSHRLSNYRNSIPPSSNILQSIHQFENKNNILINITGTIIQPIIDNNNLETILQNQTEIKDNKILGRDKKRMLDIVHIFDDYLDFMDMNFENLTEMKYKTYDLLNFTRSQFKAADQIEKRIKRLQKQQTTIEAD